MSLHDSSNTTHGRPLREKFKGRWEGRRERGKPKPVTETYRIRLTFNFVPTAQDSKTVPHDQDKNVTEEHADLVKTINYK